MNLGFRTRYLARVFVDAASVVGRMPLAKQLADKINMAGFQPKSVMATREGQGGFVQATVFENEGWTLHLLPDSFDLALLPTAATEGRNMGTLEQFVAIASRVLSTAIDHYGRQGHRLALVEEGLLQEMPVEQIEAIRKRLLPNPPGTGPDFFEWDWRLGWRRDVQLGGQSETLNEIVMMKRAAITIGAPEQGNEKERVAATVDVNTAPMNDRQRFAAAAVREFFTIATERHAEISRSVDGYLEER